MIPPSTPKASPAVSLRPAVSAAPKTVAEKTASVPVTASLSSSQASADTVVAMSPRVTTYGPREAETDSSADSPTSQNAPKSKAQLRREQKAQFRAEKKAQLQAEKAAGVRSAPSQASEQDGLSKREIGRRKEAENRRRQAEKKPNAEQLAEREAELRKQPLKALDLLPYRENATIPPKKIQNYLLDGESENPVAAAKAAWFHANLGFRNIEPHRENLHNQLRAGLEKFAAARQEKLADAMSYRVDIPIAGVGDRSTNPDGTAKTHPVRTIWYVKDGSTQPNFSTATFPEDLSSKRAARIASGESSAETPTA